MENTVTLKTQDSKNIEIITNGNSDKIIIFVHGLTGSGAEHFFYNAARFFPQKGFMTARFNLYGHADEERKLEECTISIHASDLSHVINHFKDKEITLVGHSLAGPTILLADTKNVKKIVFWDPALYTKALAQSYDYNKEADLFLSKRRFKHAVSKDMIDEYGRDDWIKLLNELTLPTKVIFAGNARHKVSAEKITVPFTIIENASHGFDEEGTEEELFKETLTWIQ